MQISSECSDKLLEIRFEICANLRVRQRDLAVCLHDAELVAHIVTRADKIHRCQTALLGERDHRISKIDLAAFLVHRGLLNDAKNLWRHNNAAKDRIAGHNLIRRRLFDDIIALHDIVAQGCHIQCAIFRHILTRHFLHAHRTETKLLIRAAKLADDRVFREDHVVAIQNAERFIAYKGFCAQDCIRQALCLLLADKINVRQVRNRLELLIDMLLGGVVFEVRLQFKGMVKMIFYDALAAVGIIRISSIPAATASSTMY